MASRVLRSFSRLYTNTASILHHAPHHPSSTALRCLSMHPRAPLLPPHRPTLQPQRHMSRPAYTRPYVIDCVMLNLKLFDKVNPDKLTLDAHFHKDLGLDSLDHVEIVMAIEDEFGFEIPDMDAQKLLTPRHFVNYLCDKYDIYDGWERGDGNKSVDEPHAKHSECPPEDPWEKAGLGKSHV